MEVFKPSTLSLLFRKLNLEKCSIYLLSCWDNNFLNSLFGFVKVKIYCKLYQTKHIQSIIDRIPL